MSLICGLTSILTISVSMPKSFSKWIRDSFTAKERGKGEAKAIPCTKNKSGIKYFKFPSYPD